MKANCTAFAYKLENDPRTGNPFQEKPQPGEFAGKSCIPDLDAICMDILSGKRVTIETVENVIINAAKADGNVLGFEISEVESADYPTKGGQWLVALGYGIYEDVYGYNYDYHWWRRMDDGIWFHKPGTHAVQAYDSSGKIITDPGTCNRGVYQYFLGYYLVTPTN